MTQKTTKKKIKKEIEKIIKEEYKFTGRKVKRMKKASFVEVLTTALYNINYACKQVGIQRRTYYRWLEDDSEFKRACNEIDESIKDEVETFLQKKIQEGDTASTIFYLKTKAKDRGYVERRESVHSGELKTNLIPNTIIIQAPNEKKEKVETEPIPREHKETETKVREPEVPKNKPLDTPPQDTSKPGWA